MPRLNKRAPEALRSIDIVRDYTKHCRGSVLISFGDTRVLTTVSYQPGVPRFMRHQKGGWLTAEYGMLPSATHTRGDREAIRGKQSGRSLEIQRLIGRTLRTVLHLDRLGQNTLKVDCDVLQADGGTRTASITGAVVALHDAVSSLVKEGIIESSPWRHFIAAVSVGIVDGQAMLDLDYKEDSSADTDLNVVMTESGHFVEVQGTAEAVSFSPAELNNMLVLAQAGATELVTMQRQALGLAGCHERG